MMIVKKHEIHENDIILGRGGALYKHAGNQFLRDLATKLAPTYIRSSKADKSKLSRKMVDIVTSKEPSGRFLKLVDGTSDVFEDVHCSIAREKTSQCLRDAVKSLKHSSKEEVTTPRHSNAKRSCHLITPPRQKEQDLWQNIAQDNDNTVAQNDDINHSYCYPEPYPYPYPQQDQYRTSHPLSSGSPVAEVPFGNHNYYEHHHYLSDPQTQWPPQTDYYHYQQDWQKQYALTPPPPSSSQYETTFFPHDYMMEKNVLRPQTTTGPQSIPYVVSNDHSSEYEGTVGNSTPAIIPPSPDRSYSSKDRFSQNSIDDSDDDYCDSSRYYRDEGNSAKRQKIEVCTDDYPKMNNNIVTPPRAQYDREYGDEVDATENDKQSNTTVPDFDEYILDFTKSTSRSFDSFCSFY